ncbi:MAG: cobyrinate a,c-diamide synthase [Lachnospiraceae bacterium]|nr:cobyrinate a,c-diamide synthase [Lachnospiraceae bacterium]
MKRFMIAAPESGSGKTTMTCALLMALKKRGLDCAAFKCGPDYIDPMFHRKALGVPSYNLDPILFGKEGTKYLLEKGMAGRDIGVLEGVMGYYDGIGMGDEGSTYSVAKLTGTPVIALIDCRKSGRSAVTKLLGLRSYREDSNIQGVIFNHLSKKLWEGMKKEAESLGVKCCGFIPEDKAMKLESRHLGLITPDEVKDLAPKLERLSDLTDSIDFDAILEIASAALKITTQRERLARGFEGIKIGVAMDEAFCFYYASDLELLESMGASILYFSPLRDERLPEDISGLILGGGYPEVHAEKLAENSSMRESVKAAVLSGLPVIAQCGGFMYLHDHIEKAEGGRYPMAGVIKGECSFTPALKHFGYQTLTSQSDNLLFEKGESYPAHEFHRSVSDADQKACIAEAKGEKWECCVAGPTMFAGYSHLGFLYDIKTAERFLKACSTYSQRQQ